MTPDILLALLGFAFVMTVTPGPNNVMLMASGVNFGMRRSVPHVAGVTLGVTFMVALIGLGVGELLARHPRVETALKVACAAYLLRLAWRIAHAGPPDPGAAPGRPLTFLEAAAFQWVNPKAWGMALTAIGVYAAGDGWAAATPVALAFLLVGPPCNLLWVGMGQALRGWLAEPRRLRRFNLAMALLLVLSLLPALAG
jgi:threonine/homoserine/homoserine lactone efflux protein